MDNFKSKIYSEVIERQRLQLGRIFRHPQSQHPFFDGLADPQALVAALKLLIEEHESHSFLRDDFLDTIPDIDVSKLKSTVRTARELRFVSSLKESEQLFSILQVCTVYNLMLFYIHHFNLLG